MAELTFRFWLHLHDKKLQRLSIIVILVKLIRIILLRHQGKTRKNRMNDFDIDLFNTIIIDFNSHS